MRTSSRLSKTLLEILHDKEALPHFIQYMESRNAGRYVASGSMPRAFRLLHGLGFELILSMHLQKVPWLRSHGMARWPLCLPLLCNPLQPSSSALPSAVTSFQPWQLYHPLPLQVHLSRLVIAVKTAVPNRRKRLMIARKIFYRTFGNLQWALRLDPTVPSSFPAALTCGTSADVTLFSSSSSLSSTLLCIPVCSRPWISTQGAEDDDVKTDILAQTTNQNVNADIPVTYTTPNDDIIPLSSGVGTMADDQGSGTTGDLCVTSLLLLLLLPQQLTAMTERKAAILEV